MGTVQENKRKMNSIKLFELVKLLGDLQNRAPEKLRLTNSEFSGSQLLQLGTDNIEKQKYGVEISNTELIPFMAYFRECMSNSEVDEIVCGIYTHSNSREKNIWNGQCEYEDADFAEINVITSEKTITMYVNYQNPITRKIGSYVNVENTSWKQLPDIRSLSNRRKSLIDRVLVTSAIICEQKEKRKFKSKNEFIQYFTHVEAVEPGALAKRIRTEGRYNSIGNLKIIDITYDEMRLEILKMVYNKLKNESLRLVGSGGFNDRTYIEFEYEKTNIGFEIGLNNLKAEIEIGGKKS